MGNPRKGLEKPSPSEFSEWFDNVIREAQVYDYGRYPVKGTGVWMPYGFSIRRRVTDLIRSILDDAGHEEVLFPMLIPEDLLVKEEEHIKGFRDEVYWVTHGGLEELDVKYALRPTSETSISFMESLWLSSYKQLPKLYYQIVSIFRYETKATRAMIRLREVTTFKEAHTAHATFEDADRQVKEAVGLYSKIFDSLGIPYTIQKRPDWDKFAGALYTIAFDTIMPDGKTLQIGTVHHLGQSFSKALDVKIQLPNEENDYVWQTSYGISDRIIASLIAIHGDKRGLKLPYSIAPIQVILVPIPGKSDEENEAVKRHVDRVMERLKQCGVRARVDWRDELTPGRKFYEWEQKGVPIRLEIGPREARENTVFMARRDTLEKRTIPLEMLCETLEQEGKSIDESLKEKAWSWMRERITRCHNLEEARESLASKRGIVEVPWCGKASCGLRMEEETEGKTLGSPIRVEEAEWARGAKCPVCGAPAVTTMRLAKSY